MVGPVHQAVDGHMETEQIAILADLSFDAGTIQAIEGGRQTGTAGIVLAAGRQDP